MRCSIGKVVKSATVKKRIIKKKVKTPKPLLVDNNYEYRDYTVTISKEPTVVEKVKEPEKLSKGMISSITTLKPSDGRGVLISDTIDILLDFNNTHLYVYPTNSVTQNCQLASIGSFSSLLQSYFFAPGADRRELTKVEMDYIMYYLWSMCPKKIFLIDIAQQYHKKLLEVVGEDKILSYMNYKSTNHSEMAIYLIKTEDYTKLN